MLRLSCPICGTRDETEFVYGGDASVKRPALSVPDTYPWLEFVFYRDNMRGRHLEYWQHVQGCRQWLVLERDTATHEHGDCRLASETEA